MRRPKIYAIVESGGKQYKVTPGQTLLVDKLPSEEGKAVELKQVLLVADGEEVKVGTPMVAGAKVTATSLGEQKGEKVTVFKYKPKVRYRRKVGHRQLYTRLAINKILLGRKTSTDGA